MSRPSALVFPYVSLEADLAQRLSPLMEPIAVYLTAAAEKSDGLAELAEQGAIRLIGPDPDLDPDQVRAAMAEFQGWVQGARDVKDLAHLRALAGNSGDDEPSGPSALMSAIRTYDRPSAESQTPFHVFLNVAEAYDRRREELDHLVGDIRAYEAGLGAAVGLKADEPDEAEEAISAALDPLDIPTPQAAPLTGLRLKAWGHLFRAQPTTADVWLTDSRVIAHLLDMVDEMGVEGFGPAAALRLEGLTGEQMAEAIHGARRALLDLAKLEPVAVGQADELIIWPFPAPMLGQVLGLEPDRVGGGVVVEVRPWSR